MILATASERRCTIICNRLVCSIVRTKVGPGEVADSFSVWVERRTKLR